MHTYSIRHRMQNLDNEFPFEAGDYVSYRVGDDMIAHGEIFQVLKGDQVLIQFGNGGRGLDYVAKSRIIEKK